MMNFRFLLLGNNTKLLNDYCYDFNHELWIESTDYFIKKIKAKYPDVHFAGLKNKQKLEMIQKIQPNIKMVQDDLFVSSDFINGEYVVFLDERGVFKEILMFSLKHHLYSNYAQEDDFHSFLLTKTQTFKNGVLKKDIDFSTNAISNNNFMIQQYDIYHKVKKQIKSVLKEDEESDLSIRINLELINHYGNFFTEGENFRLFELPLIDFLNYHSIESFLPDFYFNLSGKSVFIYDDDLTKHVKNINTFIDYIKKLPNNTKFTLYSYNF